MVSYYSQFQDRVLPKSYKHTKYDISGSDTAEYRSTIKSHILNQGGLYVSCNYKMLSTTISGKTFYFRDPTDAGSDKPHALAIIGWDDNFAVTVGGTTYNGAWIALGSYGALDNKSDGGIVYFLYDDPYYTELVGYTYEEQFDDLYFYNDR